MQYKFSGYQIEFIKEIDIKMALAINILSAKAISF